MELSNNVVWLGMQPHKMVIDELQACDALLQPSVTAKNGDSEGGAPTIILEAQACGVPVLSTDHADIPYITIPNESALLAKEFDTDDLVKKILNFLDFPQIWAKMGKAGRANIEKYHNGKQEVLALEKIYKLAVSNIQ